MSRSNPRRPASSRATTSRPRKIAGRDLAAGPEPDAPEDPTLREEPPDERADEPDEPGEPELAPEPGPGSEAGPEPTRTRAGGSALASPRTTRMLLVLAAVLAVVLAAQGAWWLRHSMRDEPAPVESDGPAISVPSGRPVVASALAVQEGVQAAAEAAQKIVARSHQEYDAEVDAAVELMTDDFAEQYRETTEAVKEEFVARKTTVEVRVVAQGVVRANDAELQALLFLNQSVTRQGGKQPKTTYTPYRALLTMVNTDQGWLVDDIETK